MHIEFRLTLKVVFRWDPLAVFLVRRFILTRRGLEPSHFLYSKRTEGGGGAKESRVKKAKRGEEESKEGRREPKSEEEGVIL